MPNVKLGLVVKLRRELDIINLGNLLDINGHCDFIVGKFIKEEWFVDYLFKEMKIKLLSEDSVWLDKWFNYVRPWTRADLNGRRLVWVSVYGLPPSGWIKEKFQDIG